MEAESLSSPPPEVAGGLGDAGAPAEEFHCSLYTRHFMPDLATNSSNSHLDGTLGPPAFCEGSPSCLAPQFNPESPYCGGHLSIGTSEFGESDTDLEWHNGVSTPGGTQDFCGAVERTETECSGSSPGELEGVHLVMPSAVAKDAHKNQQKTAQEMFLESILQAQLCVLDLQDELDKQPNVTGQPDRSSSHPPETQALGGTQEYPASLTSSEDEDGNAMPDSSEEDLDDLLWSPRGGEDGFFEGDSDEECHFYNNPLFEGSPCPAVIRSPGAGQARDSQTEQAPSCEEAPEVGSRPDDKEDLFWTNCTGQARTEALDSRIDQRTKAVWNLTSLPRGSAGGGPYSDSTLDCETRTAGRLPQEKFFESTKEDAQELGPSEHLPQESDTHCSSSQPQMSSSDADGAECDQRFPEGLLLSDSSFSTIASLLLNEEDYANNAFSFNTQGPLGIAAESCPLFGTRGPLGSAAESGPSVDTQDPLGSVVESCPLVGTWSLLGSVVESCPSVDTRDPVGSAAECGLSVDTQDPLGSATESGLSVDTQDPLGNAIGSGLSVDTQDPLGSATGSGLSDTQVTLGSAAESCPLEDTQDPMECSTESCPPANNTQDPLRSVVESCPPVDTQDSQGSAAESRLSEGTRDILGSCAESCPPVDNTQDPLGSATESCPLTNSQELLGSSAESCLYTSSQERLLGSSAESCLYTSSQDPLLGSNDSITSSFVMVQSPPLTPDLISWEEPVPAEVTFYGRRPSTPAHLLEWAMGQRSPAYSSSEEEEADGPGPGERSETTRRGDSPGISSRAEDGVDGPACSRPSRRTRSPSVPLHRVEFEVSEVPSLSNGALKDRDTAKILATKLYNLDGFRRTEVAPHLQKNTDFSRMVAQEYLTFFDFAGKTLDQALRSLLKVLVLTGETQERERVLQQFSRRFYFCNPEPFSSADAVHTLTCAVMLLNSDLHGKNIGRPMTCSEFIVNLEGMNDGANFPKDQLKELYHSIRNEKLQWAVDEEEVHRLEPPHLGGRKRSIALNEVPLPDPRAETYMQGVLARKMHADIDGKRTPWGKRSWKDFYTVLKGTMLCLMKEEYRPDYQYSEEVISVHHSLAERASRYNKRPNVFRLQTADWRIYLFQAPSTAEMNSWVSRINLVAAMFSSPPFPAAIGSQKRFVRPILPVAQCKHSLQDQRQNHELWMDTFTDDLADHQKNLPDKKSKARDWEEYRTRGEYLLYEKIRYETYVKLLEAKLRCDAGTGDLDEWESQLREPGDTTDGPSDDGSPLKKAHSSPSLNLEPAPTIKVKRNISERRTYRKIIPKRNKNLV